MYELHLRVFLLIENKESLPSFSMKKRKICLLCCSPCLLTVFCCILYLCFFVYTPSKVAYSTDCVSSGCSSFQCTVQVKLELGHRAQLRKKVTSEGFTHDWMVFVRGPETGDIQHFVEKVVFRLHESFPKPKRGRVIAER